MLRYDLGWAGREYVVSSIQERTDVVSWSGVMSKQAVLSDSSHDVLTVFEADRLSWLSFSAFPFGRVGIFMSLSVARVQRFSHACSLCSLSAAGLKALLDRSLLSRFETTYNYLSSFSKLNGLLWKAT